MLIPFDEIARSVTTENPWWATNEIPKRLNIMERRAYFTPFYALVSSWEVNRAVILLGPRRVGKTVMIHHIIGKLMHDGYEARSLMYVSIDTPTYTGQSLQFFIDMHTQISGVGNDDRRVVIFDEIQYLADWERHLKVLVDKNPHIKFIASGSAAAALKLASTESGAGRFTEFMLPPLTFDEYLRFVGKPDLAGVITKKIDRREFPQCENLGALNEEFINYINFGGYPEAVVSESVRMDAARFIKSDIIDKVLLRDLPQLYGITNIQELNNLFTSLAYLTGQEISLESLAQNSGGISKPTIARYMDYLEAAFLIFRVRRLDNQAKNFVRERSFKIYLTNPSMRAALFSPMTGDSEGFGHLVETAIFSQWFHSRARSQLHYARWKRSGRAKVNMGDHGEIDLVHLDSELKPNWLIEIKWSDTAHQKSKSWLSIEEFVEGKISMKSGVFTSRTTYASKQIGMVNFSIIPAAVYCFTVGRNTVQDRGGSAEINASSGNVDRVNRFISPDIAEK